MKGAISSAVLLLFTLAYADFTVRLNKGDITLTGASGGVKRSKTGVEQYVVYPATGKRAVLESKSDGLRLQASTSLRADAQRVATAKPNAAGLLEITEAVAIGNVQLDLTRPDRTSQANSNKLTYRSGKTEDRAEFEGDVTLRDKSTQGSTNLTAVGQRGFMTISPAAEKKKNPVRRAELTGSVKVTIVQAKSETARAGNYVATGDKLTVDYTVSPAQAVLSGNVKIDGSSDPDTAEITGVTKLVLSLNEKGELEALEAIGEPVKSTFRRPATKGSGRLGAR